MFSVRLRQSCSRAGGGRDHPPQSRPDSMSRCHSEVNPEWREYERTASTVANAYIGPPVSRYLHELERAVAATISARARTDDEVRRRRGERRHAVVDADPDGDVRARSPGVIGSRHLGDVKGIDKLITFDIGGTTSDMAVIPGRPAVQVRVDGRASSAADPYGRHRDHRRRRRQHRLDCGSAACLRSARRAPARFRARLLSARR